MFYVIKDNILYEYGDNINNAWEYPQEAKEISGIDMFYFENNRDKYKIKDGELVDISQTEEYLASVSAKEKAARIEEIKQELNVLDIKCIRAMREGGQDDDGVLFFDKYVAQINALREEMATLA